MAKAAGLAGRFGLPEGHRVVPMPLALAGRMQRRVARLGFAVRFRASHLRTRRGRPGLRRGLASRNRARSFWRRRPSDLLQLARTGGCWWPCLAGGLRGSLTFTLRPSFGDRIPVRRALALGDGAWLLLQLPLRHPTGGLLARSLGLLGLGLLGLSLLGLR